MNTDRAIGNWKILSGKVRERWGRLTDDDVEKIAGQRDQLVGHVQHAYGVSKDIAEQQVRDFESGVEEAKAEKQAKH